MQADKRDVLRRTDVAGNEMADELCLKGIGRRQTLNTVFAREISLMAGAFLLRGRAAVEVRIASGGIGGEDGGELGGNGHGREGRAMVRDIVKHLKNRNGVASPDRAP